MVLVSRRRMAEERQARRKLWVETQRSKEFPQYRQGGNVLNGLDAPKTKELMLNLALPWNESAPVTVDRMTWLMPMLADYPIEILRFLRDICNMTETTEDFFGLGYNQRADLGDNQVCELTLFNSKSSRPSLLTWDPAGLNVVGLEILLQQNPLQAKLMVAP